MSALPEIYPFSPYLASIDPLGIYPEAHSDPSRVLAEGKYAFPHLRAEDIQRVEAFLTNGGVIDPLNIVFWGGASLGRVRSIVDSLSRWVPTFFSAPQWGLATEDGATVKLERLHSLQHTRLSSPYRTVILLTRIVGSFARQHVRIMTPIVTSGPWGTIALAGAHTQAKEPRRTWPPLWHRISDWHEARNNLRDDVLQTLGHAAFEHRIFPTEGVWQGKPFDGRVMFFRL